MSMDAKGPLATANYPRGPRKRVWVLRPSGPFSSKSADSARPMPCGWGDGVEADPFACRLAVQGDGVRIREVEGVGHVCDATPAMRSAGLGPAEGKGHIVAAETERVVERVVDPLLAGRARDDVEINL